MANFRLSCHQITWGKELDQALEDISHFGYRGTETFATVVDDFDGREDELRDKLQEERLKAKEDAKKPNKKTQKKLMPMLWIF